MFNSNVYLHPAARKKETRRAIERKTNRIAILYHSKILLLPREATSGAHFTTNNLPEAG